MRFLLIILLLVSFFATAQTQKSREALEIEKKENLKRINDVKKILGQTQKEKNASLSQAKVIQRQIENQEKKISLANQDIALINKEIIENEKAQVSLKSQLSVLQEEYSEIIVREAKNSRKLTKMGFLFSSNSVTELFMRYKYLKQYSENRKVKFDKIKNLSELLQARKQELASSQVQQTQVVKQVSEDKKGLDQLKGQQDIIVKELTSKEGQLKTELKKQQAALASLNSIISVAIAKERAARKAEEDARAREIAAKEKEAARVREIERAKARELERAREAERKKEEVAKNVPTKENKTDIPKEIPTPIVKKEEPAPKPVEVVKPAAPTRTEIATVASGKFSAARNKLSWPSQGFISTKFGVRDHAVLKGIKVDNHGVDIRTTPGAEVRSVFEGVVLDISEIPGLNFVVAIQHGDYYTVYANLATVGVRINQKVNGREIIGTVAEKDGVPEINFQVWHNFSKLNPELWLGSK